MQKDLSMDEAKAKAWVQEVQQEIELVNELVGKVDTFMQELQDESDPVMTILRNASERVSSFGQQLRKSFTEASKGLVNAIDILLKRQQEVLSAGESYKSTLGGR